MRTGTARLAPLGAPSLALLLAASLAGCAAGGMDPEELAAPGYDEGVAFDELRTSPPEGFDDGPVPYSVPEDLPTLEQPEIIVSLEGLTVHLFDRATGFSRVYPTGVGRASSRGESITPTGHFATGPDIYDRWWYMPSRWTPAYFEGYPFLRLTIENSRGWNTYALHGPITDPLERGFVSAGCMRMDKADIVELFHLVRRHPSTPVTIQTEVELDADGEPVDIDRAPALFPVDEPVVYGASVGPPEATEAPEPALPGFIGDACDTDADCDEGGFFCHEAGFCTLPCAGYCLDRLGHANTFCVEDPAAPGEGTCVSQVGRRNAQCALVPGTVPSAAPRFVGETDVPAATAEVCLPVVD
jgi:lipoprotein-anchoring transpeptidase ErfK/SrfK